MTMNFMMDSQIILLWLCTSQYHMILFVLGVVIVIVKMAEAAKKADGFECKFVQDPPKWLQTECPICLHILREPYQVTCCGKSFCGACIRQIKADRKPCPCCKEKNYDNYTNKGLQQPLYGFQVYCCNEEEGCKWTGELGQLDNHLNLNDLSEKSELKGCEFAKIKCTFCSNTITRKQMLHHKYELCDKRPYSCNHCNSYESTYEDVINHHWLKCGSYPVDCLNKCGAILKRQDVQNHTAHECPLTIIECAFSYAGCEVRLPCKDMPVHIRDSLAEHFSLLARSHKEYTEAFKMQQETLKSQQDEIKRLKKEIKALRKQQDVIRTQNFEEARAQNEQIHKLKLQTKCLKANNTAFPIRFDVGDPNNYVTWTSRPFYSHHERYKLCLQKYFKASDSVYYLSLCLMHGEFDDQLEWPLIATVKINLVRDYSSNDSEFCLQFHSYLKEVQRIQEQEGIRECNNVSLTRNAKGYTNSGILHIRVIAVHLDITL